MRAVFLIAILSMSAGCSSLSSSPMYRDVQVTPSAHEAVVTFFRTEESMLYLLRDAPVYVNNANEVSLARGSFHSYVLSPGKYRFMTKNWDVNSECVIDLNIKDAREFFIEVVPNSDSVAQLAVDGLIWMTKVQATGSITSISVGDYNQMCQGMFAFIPTRPEIAMQKLPGLRLAN